MAGLQHFWTVLVCLTLIPGLGCNDRSAGKSQDTCAQYFDFDAVEHFRLAIAEEEIWELEAAAVKTTSQQHMLNTILEDAPTSLGDSGMVSLLPQLGFVERDIPSSRIAPLGKIFCERKHADAVYAACIAIYRDILVFRKKGRISGIAKLCFSCNQSHLVGTERDVLEFGQSGDFARLKVLLE